MIRKVKVTNIVARKESLRLAKAVATKVARCPNETTLVHEIEKELEKSCHNLAIPWTPFNLDKTIPTEEKRKKRFVDVAHGAVLIEYEFPFSFRGAENAKLRHAQNQAEEYARYLSMEEGRTLTEYILVACDGSHICFGRFTDPDKVMTWESIRPFDSVAGERLLISLAEEGIPLVHPRLLSAIVGPDSEFGLDLIPAFFDAVRKSSTSKHTTKTKLLFTEWRRLFGQAIGIQSDQLKELLHRQAHQHDSTYADDPASYLFALNTFIALVAKLVAALSLPQASQDLTDERASIKNRIAALESGKLFADSGVANMLNADFFSWYADDAHWDLFVDPIRRMVARLAGISFDVARKSPASTRDLFKGMYQSFVPRALRHALGEFYTPDWLAAHALDVIHWDVGSGLIDPTCGTGTFVLEALKRRLSDPKIAKRNAPDLLRGLYGLDLNPLAVLAARASVVVFLSKRLRPDSPLQLPIYLADAINPARPVGNSYKYKLQTELGTKHFEVPAELVHHPAFFQSFKRAQELIVAGYTADSITKTLCREFKVNLENDAKARVLTDTWATLIDLHQRKWNGIWCSIIAERFAAGAIQPSTYICGNPPWVKWSHLPPEYASFIKDRCMELGVFSEDRWVGGIESDISTVITYEAIDKWLAPDGILAFFITGTVFANESSQGFRKFKLEQSGVTLKVESVEDFAAVAPFEGVTNHPTLLILRRDAHSEFPVPYRVWKPPVSGKMAIRYFNDAGEFRNMATYDQLLAMPVPGTDAGPWLKGKAEDIAVWKHIFKGGEPAYQARKGITTDLNGLFFLSIRGREGKLCSVVNNPDLGRKNIPTISATIEDQHIFPLIRGRGLAPFKAVPDPDYRVLVPQRGMHGDPDLPVNARATHRYLSRFEEPLLNRSSYKRFQRGKPYWSIWSVGPYTFSKYKVLWQEMSGGEFVAAYIGEIDDVILGKRVVIPDHKVYFVPCGTENEAAYLTALLNAPTIAHAISAYAAQLSLGASVVEYLNIPKFDPSDHSHMQLAHAAMKATRNHGQMTAAERERLELLALKVFGVPAAIVHADHRAERRINLEIVTFEKANPFETHLPVYSLKAAAGKFSGSQGVDEEGWVEVRGRKLDRRMFVAQAVGKSMEPRIQDHSYCIFQANPVGSRQGKIVLAQYRGPADPDTGGQYTVKRYWSKKIHNPDETWKHEEIRLEPLNPAYDPISLYPKHEGDVQVLAEFVDVLAPAK